MKIVKKKLKYSKPFLISFFEINQIIITLSTYNLIDILSKREMAILEDQFQYDTHSFAQTTVYLHKGRHDATAPKHSSSHSRSLAISQFIFGALRDFRGERIQAGVSGCSPRAGRYLHLTIEFEFRSLVKLAGSSTYGPPREPRRSVKVFVFARNFTIN